MRDYGKVHTSLWTSSTIRNMSEDGRALAFYLLTCPHGTISGVFRLPDGYVCEDIQWTPERVKKGFDELLKNGFASRCETTKWVFIYKHFEWNQPENPNQKKSAAKVAFQIPDECAWKPLFMRNYADFLGIEYSPKPNPSETLCKPFLNQEQEQEQEQEHKTVTPSQPVCETKNQPVANAPGTESSGKDETALQAACRVTAKAYASAYWDRYQTEPVINAKVRSQIKQFCQRLSHEEAPQVAAFFLTHQSSYYVRKCHDIGSMLSDAEKLRTEWATNRQITGCQAMQADRSRSNMNAADEAMRILESAGVA